MRTVAAIMCALVMCAGTNVCPAADQVFDANAVIAVADFRCVGDVGLQEAGKAAAELMRAELATRGMQIGERTDLTGIFNERDLQAGCLATATDESRQSLLTGVSYVVVGSVVKTRCLRVVVRMVRVSDGVVVRTAMASGGGGDAVMNAVSKAAEMLTGQVKLRPVAPLPDSTASYSGPKPSDGAIPSVPQTQAIAVGTATVSQMHPRVRCLWAKVRMLQRCLGADLIAPLPNTNESGELATQLAMLEAEHASLAARIDNGEAVVATTPVCNDPVVPDIKPRRTPPPQRTTSTTPSKKRRYKRVAYAVPKMMSFGDLRSLSRSRGGRVSVSCRR